MLQNPLCLLFTHSVLVPAFLHPSGSYPFPLIRIPHNLSAGDQSSFMWAVRISDPPALIHKEVAVRVNV
jgi:hypothetical protein